MESGSRKGAKDSQRRRGQILKQRRLLRVPAAAGLLPTPTLRLLEKHMTSSGESPRVAPVSSSTGRMHVELCGRFGVHLDGAPVSDDAMRRSKTRAVLSMLALAPQFQLRREQVADALWPDLDGDAAANQLAKAVHALRRAFEPDLAARAQSRFLESSDGLLHLTAPGGVTVDAVEFRDAARFGLAAGTSAALDSAVALIPGELLPEFLYEPWTMPLRDEIRTSSARVLERAAELREQAGDARRAERLWRRLLDVEPASESAFQGLIRSAIRRGDRTEALRLLAVCRETLRRELDVEPDESTVTMARTAVQSCGVQETKVGADLPTYVNGLEISVEQAGDARNRTSVREARSLPLAVLCGWGARARRTAGAAAIVALTVVFVATTAPGRSVQRATRSSVRSVVSIFTGEPADPSMVVLAGRGVAPHARVDVVGSRSGLATFADAEGRFSLPGVAWRPGQKYRIAVSEDGQSASIAQVVASHVPSDRGVLDIGSLPVTDTPLVALEDVAGLNSFAVVEFHGDAFLAGVVRAVTVEAASDSDRVGAIDDFVASLYDPNALDRRTPHETVALGSGRASDLNDAMAALARIAGYESRLVDVGDPDHPGLTYPLVEVSFDGAWHVYDPATATRFSTEDGRVPSFAEAQRVPGTVRLAGPNGRTYWNAEWLRRLYASPLHRYRLVRSEAGLIG